MRRIKQALPILALAGALVALAGLTLSFYQRQAFLTDTGETGPAVEATLARLQALRPTSVDDPALRRAVEEARHAPYIATIWLVAPDGRIVYCYCAGSTAGRGAGTVEQQATDETRRILAALPADALTGEQRTWLLTASAIQAEGEHNDVYRHLVRAIPAPDGSLAALVGVAYDVSTAIGASPDVLWVLNLLGVLAGLGIYWLALPGWVFLDARERGERAWFWAAFVFIGNLVALIAYVLARAPRSGATAA